jgi:hypothetical protein
MLRLIFNNRLCIKKLKLQLHPDKRPNEQQLAQEEWQQMDECLTTLNLCYPKWQELSNVQDLEFICQNKKFVQEQQTLIQDKALSLGTILEFVNMELQSIGISTLFPIDFKSRCSTFGTSHLLDGALNQICRELQVMKNMQGYQPCLISMESNGNQEQNVIDDSKYWKKLMCQKLGKPTNVYETHFVADLWGNSTLSCGLEKVSDTVNMDTVTISSPNKCEATHPIRTNVHEFQQSSKKRKRTTKHKKHHKKEKTLTKPLTPELLAQFREWGYQQRTHKGNFYSPKTINGYAGSLRFFQLHFGSDTIKWISLKSKLMNKAIQENDHGKKKSAWEFFQKFLVQ